MLICHLYMFFGKVCVHIFCLFFLHKVVATGLLSPLPIPPVTRVTLPMGFHLGGLFRHSHSHFKPRGTLITPLSLASVPAPTHTLCLQSFLKSRLLLPSTLQETCPSLLWGSTNPIMLRALILPRVPNDSQGAPTPQATILFQFPSRETFSAD